MSDTAALEQSPSPTAPPGVGGPHVYEFTVRFGDIDVLGHVNNVRFLGYLEDARVAMLFVDPARDGGKAFEGLVVARHEVDYLRPLKFGPDPVRVETWVREIAAAKFVLDYEIRDAAQCYLRASTVVVAYDVAAERPRRLTDAEVRYLRRFLRPTG